MHIPMYNTQYFMGMYATHIPCMHITYLMYSLSHALHSSVHIYDVSMENADENKVPDTQVHTHPHVHKFPVDTPTESMIYG